VYSMTNMAPKTFDPEKLVQIVTLRKNKIQNLNLSNLKKSTLGKFQYMQRKIVDTECLMKR
jgi:hypothetical protein